MWVSVNLWIRRSRLRITLADSLRADNGNYVDVRIGNPEADMLATMEDTRIESVSLAPESTLTDRIEAVCEAQALGDEPRKLVAAFTSGDTVFLVFKSPHD
jgi:hypothetical protein